MCNLAERINVLYNIIQCYNMLVNMNHTVYFFNLFLLLIDFFDGLFVAYRNENFDFVWHLFCCSITVAPSS